jgi:uncharacterized protein YgbK (DUF1537 family)
VSKIIVGCVADDFSGASDAASFFVKAGIRTFLFNGVPTEKIDYQSDYVAIIIALKTRTEEKNKAVNDSLKAFEWLKANGAELLFLKYCSTFDSTREGNIGPVIDAVMEKYRIKYTILCPALPVNGRIVQDGNLLINGVPLNETHMKNHPLTPMWDSDISKLIEPQGKYRSIKINYEVMKKNNEEILEIINQFGKDKEHFYVIPDFIEEGHSRKIVEVFGELPFLTGGSGLMYDLGIKYQSLITQTSIPNSKTDGKAIILAGSCSKATLEQVEDYIGKGYESFKIDPVELYNENQTKETIWNFVKSKNADNILIYSSDISENVKKVQRYGATNISRLLERTTAYIAKKAVDSGYKRIIVAGGETSGAVTKILGYTGYIVGESIAPGVPVMIPIVDNRVRLILKSGNFGQKDFFYRSIEFTRGVNS